jgi:membrane-associated phospholipid phosphatase
LQTLARRAARPSIKVSMNCCGFCDGLVGPSCLQATQNRNQDDRKRDTGRNQCNSIAFSVIEAVARVSGSASGSIRCLISRHPPRIGGPEAGTPRLAQTGRCKTAGAAPTVVFARRPLRPSSDRGPFTIFTKFRTIALSNLHRVAYTPCHCSTATLGDSYLSRFQTWSVGLLSTVVAVAISVTWLDKPIAYGVHNAFGQIWVLAKFTETPSFFGLLATVVFIVFLVRRITLRPFAKLDVVLILSDISIVVTRMLVLSLKFIFGRTWPQYHDPSLIPDGVYGFYFLHDGLAFGSFPSGHMASICSLFAVIWMCYPRFRGICAACAVSVAGALIVGNYHFLSDVIAGTFVGASIAVLIVSVGNALVPAALSQHRPLVAS